jgi:hypothetical protein
MINQYTHTHTQTRAHTHTHTYIHTTLYLLGGRGKEVHERSILEVRSGCAAAGNIRHTHIIVIKSPCTHNGNKAFATTHTVVRTAHVTPNVSCVTYVIHQHTRQCVCNITHAHTQKHTTHTQIFSSYLELLLLLLLLEEEEDEDDDEEEELLLDSVLVSTYG